jgi:2'-5' RNA ligase
VRDSRFALYLIPPYDVAEPIASVHSMLCKQYGFKAANRFQVHMTIQGFFKKIPGPIEPLLKKLDELLMSQMSFNVELGGFHVEEVGFGFDLSRFKDKPNKVLLDFLSRVVEVVKPYIASDCNFIKQDLGRAFRTHITLAFRDVPAPMYDHVFQYLKGAQLPSGLFLARNFHFLEFFSEDWSGSWWQTLTWRLLKIWRLNDPEERK